MAKINKIVLCAARSTHSVATAVCAVWRRGPTRGNLARALKRIRIPTLIIIITVGCCFCSRTPPKCCCVPKCQAGYWTDRFPVTPEVYRDYHGITKLYVKHGQHIRVAQIDTSYYLNDMKSSGLLMHEVATWEGNRDGLVGILLGHKGFGYGTPWPTINELTYSQDTNRSNSSAIGRKSFIHQNGRHKAWAEPHPKRQPRPDHRHIIIGRQ